MKPHVSGLVLVTALGFLAGCQSTIEEAAVSSTTQDPSPLSISAGPPGSPWDPYASSPQPSEIRIPELGIRAQIQPVGMLDEETMQVPRDISVVGWFDASAFPASEVGHAVLVGHRDGVDDPNGVFRRISELSKGDTVSVVDLGSRRSVYRIKRTRVLSRTQFAQQSASIFAEDGVHRLILLTCGGAYDRERGGYQSTVVVTAEPMTL
jgi:LPXTG-site transpeptidase (sortase) family protein